MDLYENYARRVKLLNLVHMWEISKWLAALVWRRVSLHLRLSQLMITVMRDLVADKYIRCAHRNRNSQREVGEYKQHGVFSLVAHSMHFFDVYIGVMAVHNNQFYD